jgi:hypothetical protein
MSILLVCMCKHLHKSDDLARIVPKTCFSFWVCPEFELCMQYMSATGCSFSKAADTVRRNTEETFR